MLDDIPISTGFPFEPLTPRGGGLYHSPEAVMEALTLDPDQVWSVTSEYISLADYNRRAPIGSRLTLQACAALQGLTVFEIKGELERCLGIRFTEYLDLADALDVPVMHYGPPLRFRGALGYVGTLERHDGKTFISTLANEASQ